MKKPIRNWIQFAKLFYLAIPVILVLFVFISNRSLFLDSLNLARNIAEGSLLDLAKPLKYEQSAPLLFLYLTKLSTFLFGISEYSLRILPLVSGLASLYFFGKVLQRFVASKYVLLGVFWFGTHGMFIRYSTEFKQYITDAFICIFLVWLALKLEKLTNKIVITIAILGSISIWLSMPSIFVLLGLMSYYAHLNHKEKKSQLSIIALSIWFSLNFICEYFLILSPAIQSTHMQNFHQSYFLQGEFWKPESLSHDFGLIISTVRMAVGKSGLAIAVALALIIVFKYEAWKDQKSSALLILIPILAVFGASLLGKYSLIERLMLFTLPLLFVMIMGGLQKAEQKLSTKQSWIKYPVLGVIGIALLAGFTQTQGLGYFLEPLEIEDNRSSLIHISDHAKNTSPIITTQLAYPAYAYYTNYDQNLEALTTGEAIATKYGESIPKLAISQSKKLESEVWILMGHMLEGEITNLISELEKVGVIKNSYRTNRSAAILFSTQ